MLRVPSTEETLGAAVVARILECATKFIDTGQGSSVVDFELMWPNGQRAGLEISQITDEGLLSLSAQAHSKKLNWNLAQAKYEWHLGVEQGSNLKRLSKECDRLLAILEEEDFLAFTYTVLPGQGRARSAVQRLIDLGVLSASTSAGSPAKRVFVHPSWFSYGINPGLALNELVEEQARANVNKLQSSGYSPCHLFLWVSSLAPVFLDDMSDPYITKPPNLPTGVDVVWVAPFPLSTQTRAGHAVWPFSAARENNEVTVQDLWRVNPPAPWERLPEVQVSREKHGE